MATSSNNIQTSIIIPVLNQWPLTKNCCAALAKTLPKNVQVIIVDNGSTDETASFAPAYLQSLFGKNGTYIRNPTNRNFGPATNQGAKIAQGEYLLFLNNDTIPQDNWYQPLIQDFAYFPNLGATGPILVYPKTKPFGHTIQHLGVAFSPSFGLRNVYEGIPATSTLTNVRRFFQIITAACLLIPKQTFFKVGLFDEYYKKGLEDVDLCAKLTKLGLRQTVNPKSMVIHLTSQSAGRHQHEDVNSRYFNTHTQHLLTADLHEIWAKDGFLTKLNAWLQFVPTMPIDLDKLILKTKTPTPDQLIQLIITYPIWENGWEMLAKLGLGLTQLGQLFPSANASLYMFKKAYNEKNFEQMHFAKTLLQSYAEPWDEYLMGAHEYHDFYTKTGQTKLASIYHDWIINSDNYFKEFYTPFMNEYLQIQSYKENK